MSNPMLPNSPVYAGNAQFIEDLYERYLTQPTSVSEEWRQLFASFKGADSPMRAVVEEQIRHLFADRDYRRTDRRTGQADEKTPVAKQIAVMRLIQAYRGLGHFRARVDPIRLRAQPNIPDLEPAFHGLTEADMNTVSPCFSRRIRPGAATLAWTSWVTSPRSSRNWIEARPFPCTTAST